MHKSIRNRESDIVVFCGFDFMAETAAILNSYKNEKNVECSAAHMLSPDQGHWYVHKMFNWGDLIFLRRNTLMKRLDPS